MSLPRLCQRFRLTRFWNKITWFFLEVKLSFYGKSIYSSFQMEDYILNCLLLEIAAWSLSKRVKVLVTLHCSIYHLSAMLYSRRVCLHSGGHLQHFDSSWSHGSFSWRLPRFSGVNYGDKYSVLIATATNRMGAFSVVWEWCCKCWFAISSVLPTMWVLYVEEKCLQKVLKESEQICVDARKLIYENCLGSWYLNVLSITHIEMYTLMLNVYFSHKMKSKDSWDRVEFECVG